MKWGKILSALALSAVLLSSQVPAHAAAAASPEQLVRSSESYAGSLKWAISIEGTGDGKTIPWNYYNGTKSAYQKAKYAVSKLPNGKTKTDLLARLDKNVNLYISTTPGHVGRAVAYIDAINAGLKIEKKKDQLNARLSANIIDDVTEQYYHELSREIKKQAYLLDRVYGVTTRETIRNHFKGTAEQARQKALYPVSIQMALKELKADIDTSAFFEALPFQTEIDALFEAGSEKGLITTAVYDQLHSNYEQMQKDLLYLYSFRIENNQGYDWHRDGNRLYNTTSAMLKDSDLYSFYLYEEASQVTVSLSTDDIRDIVYTGENVTTGEINIADFKRKHGITDLKELTYQFIIKDKRGRTKIETGTITGYSPVGVPVVWAEGTWRSQKGYTIDKPWGYQVRIFQNDSEVIYNNNEIGGGNWLSIKTLTPESDLAKIREEAIEYLKQAPGEPKDFDGIIPFTKPDAEVKMHLISRDPAFTEEIIVLKINNQLVKLTSHIDANSPYPEDREVLTNIIKSIQ